MAIGTSLGGFFKDKMDFHLGIDQYDTTDQNEVSPDKMMRDRKDASDPHNVYDDAGNMVDYRDPMLSDESNSILRDMTRPLAPNQLPPDAQ